MRNKTSIRTAMAFGLLGLAITAHATTVIYDFTGGGSNSPSLSFEEDSLQLTVSGARNNGTAADLVTWNNNGLGVRFNQNDTTGTLDSIGPNERLIFSVDDALGRGRGLELLSIDFRGLNQNAGENFTLFVDGVRIVNNFTPTSDIWFLPNDLLDSPLAFHEFIVSVNDRPVDTETTLRIARIGGNTVPIPPTLGLVVVGLMGLALRRVRAVG